MSIVVTDLDFQMIAGDKKVIEVAVVDEAGAAVTVTGYTASCTLKKSPGGTALVSWNNAAITKSTNKLTFTLDDADSAGLLGTYVYSPVIYDGLGNPTTIVHVDANGDERGYGIIEVLKRV